ncbi:hypothetical protein L1283_005667 [Sphingobacterium sp. HSC-15S19]|nr:hypothetical protein [Sphingobacterium siyangense]
MRKRSPLNNASCKKSMLHTRFIAVVAVGLTDEQHYGVVLAAWHVGLVRKPYKYSKHVYGYR